MHHFVILGVAILALFQGSSATKCFECISKLNSNCGDPFTGSTATKQVACEAGCQKVTDNQGYVSRGCVLVIGDIAPEPGCDVEEGGSEWCVCNKDLCNAAPEPAFSSHFLWLTGLAVVLARWIN
ncbi:protein quiver [Lingula anatina]|uniref:Protein quiver n=1 Tax=Lingula anatina TaxID=7574 RepID=A0A1S3H7F3_LINAN|nr:protein quiver [Lingula anatina]|eukprot:XP_013381416.1 protein quiver [Lingula anatina]